MVNLDLIEETLDSLIHEAPTTFKTCEYIAHLTIAKEVLLDKVGKPMELEWLISDFGNYTNVKMIDASENMKNDALRNVCNDIVNFVKYLYRESESANDKNILRQTIGQLEKEVLNDGNNL